MEENTSPEIKDSDFYKLCKEKNLLNILEPTEEQFGIRIQVEEFVDSTYGDKEKNDLYMYILASYRNTKGNSTHNVIKTRVRPFDKFEIDDHFNLSKEETKKDIVATYTDEGEIEGFPSLDEITSVNIVSNLVFHILGLESQEVLTNFSNEDVISILGAYISCIYQDPKFVYIYIDENINTIPNHPDNGTKYPIITMMFKVKDRPTPN